MTSRARAVSVTYYSVLTLLLIAVWLGWTSLLPEAIGPRIARNSEALLLAIVVTAWIQFVRPRAQARPLITVAGVVALLAAGIALLLSDLPSQYRTLNESLLAAAVVVAYVHPRRPLPRWIPWTISAGVIVIVAVGFNTTVVIDLAESIAVIVLVPIALDVIDRAILQPGRTDPWPPRVAWYAFLLVAPVVITLLEYAVSVDGAAGDILRYLVRTTEAPLFLLLLEGFLAIVLPWAVRQRITAATA